MSYTPDEERFALGGEDKLDTLQTAAHEVLKVVQARISPDSSAGWSSAHIEELEVMEREIQEFRRKVRAWQRSLS